MKLVRSLLIATAMLLPCFAAVVPAGSKIYIAPMEGGLDGFLAPEILKQHLPLTITTDEAAADYVLVGNSQKADDHWYNVAFRNGGKDKNEGNVRLLDTKNKTMVWAGEAGDRSLLFSQIRR